MLADERVVGSELGEEGDHGLADRVAIGALGDGEGLLHALEGGGVVAAILGGEGLLEPSAVLGEPRAGREPGGQEIVRKGLDDGERLVDLPAGEQQAGEPARRLGLARIELERAA